MGLDPKLLEYANEIIRHKARQLARKPGFCSSDREDLQQELLLAILQRWPSFDSTRASARTFIARIIENKAASLVRARHAAKRGSGQCSSLDDGTCIIACGLDESHSQRRRGIHSRTALETTLLALDVESFVDELPDNLRRLCHLLMRASISDAARSIGVRRTVLYRAIGDVRKRFTEAGFRDYLG